MKLKKSNRDYLYHKGAYLERKLLRLLETGPKKVKQMIHAFNGSWGSIILCPTLKSMSSYGLVECLSHQHTTMTSELEYMITCEGLKISRKLDLHRFRYADDNRSPKY